MNKHHRPMLKDFFVGMVLYRRSKPSLSPSRPERFERVDLVKETNGVITFAHSMPLDL